MHKFRLISLLALVATSTLFMQSRIFPIQSAHASAVLTVTGVAANNSSVRVFYSAVSGARDYRVYDVAAPMTVKYAGLVHLTAPSGQHFVTGSDGVTPVFPYAVSSTGSGPAVYDGPADSIEWNRVEDGQSHTLVVQAVDQLGPVPPSSLYDNANMPLMPGTAGMGMAQLGANEGMTSDGFNSINGQGSSSNTPSVLATSSAFVVQADATHVPIPSQTGATQTYLDTFTDAEGTTLTQTARNDAAQTMSYRLNSGTAQAATLSYQFADTKDSFPMIESGHFMDVLFDGGTPGTNNPLHQGHGSMMVTPDHPLSLAQGGMIHLTMEVDGHVNSRRWMAMALAPVSAPLTNPVWEIPQAISTTDQALVVQFFPGSCTLNIFTGPTSSTDLTATGTAGGSTYGAALWGAAGQAPEDCQYVSLPANLNQVGNPNGQGFDSRNRYDFFLTQTHAALFIDGHLLVQSDIPVGTFPWATQPLQASFLHYVYHTDNDITDNRTAACYPENAYWYNDPAVGTLASQDSCAAAYPAGFGFQRSDERHWDNLGSEVLPNPATPTDFSSLASLVTLPQPVAPVSGSGAGRHNGCYAGCARESAPPTPKVGMIAQ